MKLNATELKSKRMESSKRLNGKEDYLSKSLMIQNRQTPAYYRIKTDT